MIALLLLAAISAPIDLRITHPWELTISVDVEGRSYYHTETYRSLEACKKEEWKLDFVSIQVPQIHVMRCDYVGLA
jgi:hypothetical protein